MVLNPLDALSLATNILTLVQFSWSIVSGSIAIYESLDGASKETSTLENVTSRLKVLCDSLIASSASNPVSSRIENELPVLASECQTIAQELIYLLQSLKTPGSHSRWKSLIVAFRESRKSEEVQALVKRLERLQHLMGLYLQKALSDKQSDVFRELERLRWECRQFDWDRATQLQSMHEDLLRHIHAIRPEAKLAATDIQTFCETVKKMQPVNANDVSTLSHRIQTLAQSITNFIEDGHAASIETKFLRSLAFPSMKQRREDIEKAHARTFQWILDPLSSISEDPIHFVDWLQHKSDIYWISGKAGSGKSTLMKFISDNPVTRRTLQTWAGSRKLVIARYFFWSTGSSLERTQEGLLRSLLFDILLACRDRIHELSAALPAFDVSGWSKEDLVKSIKLVTSPDDMSVKFCFFIDGLDEYGAEDSSSLIRIIQALAQIPSIKICISSRPWNEFSEAFGQDPSLCLQLEILTRGDIQKYVESTFEENKNYRTVRARSHRYPQLIKEIVDKADGVFLWVHLVVESLTRGLTHADRIEDLESRLRHLPPTLEEYFQKMLNSVEDVYRANAVSTLQIALEADQPLGLITYSFLDEEKSFALYANAEPMLDDEIQLRQDEMKKRINGRTRGILEVRQRISMLPNVPTPMFDRYQVDFMHRTARDFLRKSSNLHELLRAPEDAAADNDVRLMYALLAQLKLGPGFTFNSIYHTWNAHYIFQEMVHCAAKATINPTVYIDAEIEEVCNEAICVAPFASETSDILLCDAARAGLVPYMRSRFRFNPQLARERYLFLLYHALQLGRLHGHPHRQFDINVEMVRLVLQHGENPNGRNGPSTDWEVFLERLHLRTLPIAHRNDVISLIEMLVEHGADMQAQAHGIPARDIIYQNLPKDVAVSILAKFGFTENLTTDDTQLSYSHGDIRSGESRRSDIDFVGGSGPDLGGGATKPKSSSSVWSKFKFLRSRSSRKDNQTFVSQNNIDLRDSDYELSRYAMRMKSS